MENSGAAKSKYPFGFYIGCLTYTFERFAFYGTKPLLVLYLTELVAKGGLEIPKATATIIAANFTAYTYIAPLIGGYICDKWLGARYAVTLGCIIMGLGYLIGWKSTSLASVNMMIYVVSIGTGLFKGNLAGLMGRMFENDDQMDAAFSIQYSFVNIGAFFGSAIMGAAYMSFFQHGEVLGYRQVFLFCGALVILGGILFTASYGKLHGQGKLPFKYRTDAHGNVIGETVLDKKEKASSAKLTKKETESLRLYLYPSFQLYSGLSMSSSQMLYRCMHRILWI